MKFLICFLLAIQLVINDEVPIVVLDAIKEAATNGHEVFTSKLMDEI
jgi:hypothetical protein